jgi:hypothetical protein
MSEYTVDLDPFSSSLQHGSSESRVGSIAFRTKAMQRGKASRVATSTYGRRLIGHAISRATSIGGGQKVEVVFLF